MAQPVSRVTSRVSGSGDKPPGEIVTGNQAKLYVHGQPVTIVGDTADNGGTVIEGSAKLFVNGQPVARVGHSLDYGGTILTGDDSLQID